MNLKIYVENLATETTETELLNLFSDYGNVADVHIAVEGVDRRSLRFGRVTMITPEGARAAIEALNGKSVGTSTLVVREWRSSPDKYSPNGRDPRRTASKLY